MNQGPPDASVPAPAATVVLARDHEGALQVLLLRRSAESRFMGGNYVFPGGLVESADHSVDWWRPYTDLAPDEIVQGSGGDTNGEKVLAAAVAAIRETFEEAGVLFARRSGPAGADLPSISGMRLTGNLPPGWLQQLVGKGGWIVELSRLLWWSRWITPEQMRYRYDTRFFVARMPQDQVCQPDMRETVHALWISPEEALAKNLSGKIPLSPPTLITLHEMLPCKCLQHLASAAAQRRRETILKPRMISEGMEKIIIEPWDPEYDHPQVRIDVASLRASIAPVGAPFSRLWFADGVWKPVTF